LGFSGGGGGGGIGNQPITIPAGPNAGGGINLIDPTEDGLAVAQTAADLASNTQVGRFADGYAVLQDIADSAGQAGSIYGFTIVTSLGNLQVGLTIDSSVFTAAGNGHAALWFGDSAGNVIGRVYFGVGVPANAGGSNNDLAVRFDGGVGSTIYRKVAGAWVGIL
jgi:hypothetical protein